ncbi:hypothetical protein [Frankia sp. R82]|uniref:hypothetical protein n=1 Tax=Frankia sp. R82 TaxID=2950553 RepID=UPI0020430E97|nr:hypothetical protein [Frankia sp. R82]MCM3884850.1 hypothetical protein [Frankia sp. R82]
MPATDPPVSGLPAFVPDDYRRRVLAAVHRRGGAEHSDPFEIYDIPLDAVAVLTDAQVRARIDEVWAFWQRNRDHPRYRGVIIGLLDRHAELTAALADHPARLALRDRVAVARAERDDTRFAALDAAARRLVARFGGLPADRIEGLRAWAATQDIAGAEFDTRIRRHRILPADATAPAAGAARGAPISPAVLRQIRSDLDELGRIAATAPPRSLFDLLGLPPDASREQIRAARDTALTRNRARRPDRRRALLDDLLAAVGTLLVDGDPRSYLDALAAASAARLRPQVAAAVLVEDTLLPTEAARLVAEARADGLDLHRAQAVVEALAQEHGVTAAPLPASDAPQPGPARDRTRLGAGSGGPSAPDGGDWRGSVSRARAALRAGRPVEAGDHVATARELAGETLPPIRAVDDEVAAAIRVAAAGWATLASLVAAARYRAVLVPVRHLVATAADVPGPGGQLPGELLSLAEARCAVADALVARARAAEEAGQASAGPGGQRARLVAEALALVADHDEALALRGTGSPSPVAAPTAVRASREAGSIVVRWQASVTPGEVRYRVSRIAADGTTRVVGVTSATELADGGASAGGVTYAVSAGLGPSWSPPARSDAPETAGTPECGSSPATGSAPVAGGTPGDGGAPDMSAARIGLRWENGRLRWTWPVECTEMVVAARGDDQPRSATDARAFTRRVTIGRYDRDGGVVLPAERPLHIAVFRGTRRDGRLVIEPAAVARLRLGPDRSQNPRHP